MKLRNHFQGLTGGITPMPVLPTSVRGLLFVCKLLILKGWLPMVDAFRTVSPQNQLFARNAL